jgi:hypothetical protein
MKNLWYKTVVSGENENQKSRGHYSLLFLLSKALK